MSLRSFIINNTKDLGLHKFKDQCDYEYVSEGRMFYINAGMYKKCGNKNCCSCAVR